jgi:hypothetical protein
VSQNRPFRWVSLCWVSLYWVSRLIYFYAECHYAECHYAECQYAECHYAECHYAECHYAKCRGAINHVVQKFVVGQIYQTYHYRWVKGINHWSLLLILTNLWLLIMLWNFVLESVASIWNNYSNILNWYLKFWTPRYANLKAHIWTDSNCDFKFSTHSLFYTSAVGAMTLSVICIVMIPVRHKTIRTVLWQYHGNTVTILAMILYVLSIPNDTSWYQVC